MWTYYISKVGKPGAQNPWPKARPRPYTDVQIVHLLVTKIVDPQVLPRIVALDWNVRWKRLRLIEDTGAWHDLRWKEDQ